MTLGAPNGTGVRVAVDDADRRESVPVVVGETVVLLVGLDEGVTVSVGVAVTVCVAVPVAVGVTGPGVGVPTAVTVGSVTVLAVIALVGVKEAVPSGAIGVVELV